MVKFKDFKFSDASYSVQAVEKSQVLNPMNFDLIQLNMVLEGLKKFGYPPAGHGNKAL